jgi:hypothetical protein
MICSSAISFSVSSTSYDACPACIGTVHVHMRIARAGASTQTEIVGEREGTSEGETGQGSRGVGLCHTY